MQFTSDRYIPDSACSIKFCHGTLKIVSGKNIGGGA